MNKQSELPEKLEDYEGLEFDWWETLCDCIEKQAKEAEEQKEKR